MYILILIHTCQAGKKGLYYKLLSRHDILINICHLSTPGALGDVAVCCGLMETGLILQLNDLCWLGGGLISSPRCLFFFKMITSRQPALFYSSLDNNHHLGTSVPLTSVFRVCAGYYRFICVITMLI